MHITILTFGSRGDVQPYLALGVGLQQAGYNVRLAAPPPFADFIQSKGLEFMPIEGEPQAMLEGEAGQKWLENNKNNPLVVFSDYAEVVRPVLRQQFDCSLAACEGTDAIIYGFLAMVAPHIAEAANIPVFLGMLQPYTPTTAFPSVFIPPNPNLGPLYNWGSHVLMEQLFWQSFRTEINNWRQEVLGLSPWSWWGHSAASIQPILLGYSPIAVPKPSDWSLQHHVTGYWFLNEEQNWQPPSDLLDFLAAGEKPVYIGFGSMLDRCPEKTTENTIEALKRTGKRGILLKGWGGLDTKIDSDDIFTIESIPHSWLFPQMSAIVHHGGAGTTGAALRSGVPMVVTPFMADQPFWSDRMNKLGVAPSPIPHKEMTAETLARAITKVTEDERIKARSRQLGEQIRAEDGIGNTVKLIDRYLQRKPESNLVPA
ncbi:MAG: glycosyltransferase [Cyanobacteria bacterium P01_E01_bin.42]